MGDHKLTPDRAIPILERQIARAEDLRNDVWDSHARREWVLTSEGALTAALNEDNGSITEFSFANLQNPNSGGNPNYKRDYVNAQLDRMLTPLRSAVEQLRWRLSDPAQIFMPAGSQLDAYQAIKRVVQTVKVELLVVDPYVDGTLWPLLSNAVSQIKIRVMTMKMPPDFAFEAKKFVAQHLHDLKIRMTTTYHDRFLLVDGAIVWHLGTSINHAGNKAFAMSELLSQPVKSAAIADVEATWATASVVVLP